MTVVALVLEASAMVTAAVAIAVLVRGPRWADRIIAIDMLFVAGLSLTIGAALHTGRKEFLDVGIVLAMIGFVATVGWARVVEFTGPRRAQEPAPPPVPALLALAVSMPAHPGAIATTAGAVCLVLGSLVLVIGAWGVLRLPDALARQHACTQAITVAIPIMAAGAALTAWDRAWTIRLLAMVACLFLTLPLASAMLAKAAIAESADPAIDTAPLID